MKIVVLSDGETFDLLENCKIVEVPDNHAESTESIEAYVKALRD